MYLYSLLLLLLYLINSQFGLSRPFMFFTTSILYYYAFNKIHKSLTAFQSTLVMAIISLPFSWHPVWGGLIGESVVLIWFYLWCGFAFLLLIFKKNLLYKKQYSIYIFLCIFLLLYSFIPLINSESLREGLKEFIMINFFISIALIGIMAYEYINEENLDKIYDIYIFTMFLMSLGIIIQFVVYMTLGVRLFGMRLFGMKLNDEAAGNFQLVCTLLLEDASSGTLMLGIAVLIAIIRRKKNKRYLFESFVITIAQACSGRRTSTLSLIIILIIYQISDVSGLRKRVKVLFLSTILILLSIYFLNLSRPFSSVSGMLDNNGRFKLGVDSLKLFFRKPLIGYGYDNVYLTSIMPSKMIVHNTILRWLNMGGLLYGTLMFFLFVFIILLAKRSYNKEMFWCLFYSMLSSMFVPDILNARFLYVICFLTTLTH